MSCEKHEWIIQLQITNSATALPPKLWLTLAQFKSSLWGFLCSMWAKSPLRNDTRLSRYLYCSCKASSSMFTVFLLVSGWEACLPKYPGGTVASGSQAAIPLYPAVQEHCAWLFRSVAEWLKKAACGSAVGLSLGIVARETNRGPFYKRV